jgi:hypothetical protein
MSYLRYLCLFVGVRMSYLRYLCLFVGVRMSYLRYLCLFVGVRMSYLRYLCLSTHSGVQQILCCFFCFVFPSLACPMLPVSLVFHFGIL